MNGGEAGWKALGSPATKMHRTKHTKYTNTIQHNIKQGKQKQHTSFHLTDHNWPELMFGNCAVWSG